MSDVHAAGLYHSYARFWRDFQRPTHMNAHGVRVSASITEGGGQLAPRSSVNSIDVPQGSVSRAVATPSRVFVKARSNAVPVDAMCRHSASRSRTRNPMWSRLRPAVGA